MINVGIHDDPVFQRLREEDVTAAFALLSLLTSSQAGRLPGLIFGTQDELLARCGLRRDASRDVFAVLTRRKLIVCDWKQNVVFVPKAYDWMQHPTQEKWWVGARQEVGSLLTCRVTKRAFAVWGDKLAQTAVLKSDGQNRRKTKDQDKDLRLKSQAEQNPCQPICGQTDTDIHRHTPVLLSAPAEGAGYAPQNLEPVPDQRPRPAPVGHVVYTNTHMWAEHVWTMQQLERALSVNMCVPLTDSAIKLARELLTIPIAVQELDECTEAVMRTKKRLNPGIVLSWLRARRNRGRAISGKHYFHRDNDGLRRFDQLLKMAEQEAAA